MDGRLSPRTRTAGRFTATAAALAAGALVGLPGAANAATTKPALGSATTFLATTNTADGVTDGTTLAKDGYYEYDAQGDADFGLTIDAGYALAAAHKQTKVLRKVVGFVENGTDGDGSTIEEYTGTAPDDEVDGTYPYISGGGLGKEALLAEMVGDDPTSFGGQNLIALLDGAICTGASGASDVTYCAGAGAYQNAYSTFSQTLGILAQLRAGDTSGAAAPVSYLLAQQESSGAWSSSLPSAGDTDVDSTAMAVMALKLVPGAAAKAAVTRAINWIASQQDSDGGFQGGSVNSTGLAIQALHLSSTPKVVKPLIQKALAFLAAEQNSDGGFDIGTGDPGSDVRATAQAANGIVQRSFGTISDPLGAS